MNTPIYYIITGGDFIGDYVYSINSGKMIKNGFLDDYKFQMPYSALNLLHQLNENFHLGIFLRLMTIQDAPPSTQSVLIARRSDVSYLTNLTWEEEIDSLD
jgi:hypothetical protein